MHKFGGAYTGEHLNHVAFPLGGIGAGMICLEGAGALSHVSARNKPEVFNEPLMFAAVCVKGAGGNFARVLEGPVPARKIFGTPGAGNGCDRATPFGLPRFDEAEFEARFPFATVRLAHSESPVRASVTGWSPFIPNNADDSSLPFAAFEYHFENVSDDPLEAVFSFHAANFLAYRGAGHGTKAVEGGFALWAAGTAEEPWRESSFSVVALDGGAHVDCAWFRGGFNDAMTMVWRAIEMGDAPERAAVAATSPSPGGSLYVPFKLAARETRVVRLILNWYAPKTCMRFGADADGTAGYSWPSNAACVKPTGEKPTHIPWYAAKFDGIEAVAAHCREDYARLREASARFSDAFYDTTLPAEVIEAVAANLTILKSPTVLRQADGRIWAYEGCCDSWGCCHGTCSHVWNYAQAMPHLFPELERGLRRTEFFDSQDDRGHQDFRASLPIRPTTHAGHAAADGQLGGIMKVYRDWRVSGDTGWLRSVWPRVKASLEYCIETWDPERKGALVEPHHNTYDVEFWGPDGMCGSFYAGALLAAARMAEALGEDASEYHALYDKARRFLERDLFDGEYFFQKIQWEGLRAGDPTDPKKSLMGIPYSPEALEILRREGPKYQYGKGCLSDGIVGAWLARACGLGDVIAAGKVKKHLAAVFRYNFRRDLSSHANPQRPGFALGHEAGLVCCSWPKGGRLTLPFPYSEEVFTGIEYQVASHLMMEGQARRAFTIVRAARARYDGRVRNPFNEYECGHWYARAMSSYAMLESLTGARYDAVEKVLYIEPRIPGDFRGFLATATGYATVGVKDGKPFIEVREGAIDVREVRYIAFEGGRKA